MSTKSKSRPMSRIPVTVMARASPTIFLLRARDMGVTYLPKTEATSLVVACGKAQGVVTDQGEISSPIVVSALGPWSNPLFEKVGHIYRLNRNIIRSPF